MKKTVSENQGKGSLVLLPGKGEMQVILCNVFLLVLKVVLQNRCNDSSRTTCGDRKLSPPRAGGGAHGADMGAWARTCRAGTRLGLSTGCTAPTKGTSTGKDVPEISSLS